MSGWVRHQGIAVPMREDNISTDAIIPSREMKRVSKIGLADGLFGNLRYVTGRTPQTKFVLNDPVYASASILLAGRNFGCGSSREHAVWALKDYGFRAIIAESFGAIFLDNCIANGLAPVTLRDEDIADIAAWCAGSPQERTVTIDLQLMEVVAGKAYSFQLPQAQRDMLLRGHSLIDVTLQSSAADIDRFSEQDRQQRPWLYQTR